jgi:carboxymethylenebutenolidase
VCFEPTALPPQPPRSGHAGDAERLDLTAADGNTLAATYVASTNGNAPGVVILPDIRGLHPYYEHLARAFADAGVHALAIDYYGRTAGPERRGDDFEWQPHREAATDETLRTDTAAGVEELKRRGVPRVFVLGFCYGGRAAFMYGTQEGVAGVVGFYGGPKRALDGGTSPIEEVRAGNFKAPVLGLFGGADQGIPPEDAHAFAEALTEAGVPQEILVYDDAPHSFFDRSMDQFAEACDDAWRRVLRFMGVPAQ